MKQTISRVALLSSICILLAMNFAFAQETAPTAKAELPSYPMAFGAFTVRFDSGGTFLLEGRGWPGFLGTWKMAGSEIELAVSGGPGGCDVPGRYRVSDEAKRVGFDVIADDCRVRRMILDRSRWAPADEPKTIPVRKISFVTTAKAPKAPKAKTSEGNWPSFRGAQASGIAEGQNLPDKWSVKSG